ncbi:MAG: ATP-binding protein, partial [Myxococcota bacterium]
GPFFYAVYLVPPLTVGLPLAFRERVVMAIVGPVVWCAAYFGPNPDYLLHPMLHVPAIVIFTSTLASVVLGHAGFVAVRDRFLLARSLERKQAELARYAANLEEEVVQSGRTIEELSKTLENTTVDRANVARQLHDELGQLIVGVRIELDVLEKQLRRLPAEDGKLAHLSSVVESLDGSVRRFIRRLREPEPVVDLAASLEELIAPLREGSGLAIRSEVDVPAGVQPAALEALYRLVQESLTNVYKHSGASEVVIRISMEDQRVVGSVRDNGCGFDANAALGLGLGGLRERAASLGGELQVASDDEGTCVRLVMPAGSLEQAG